MKVDDVYRFSKPLQCRCYITTVIDAAEMVAALAETLAQSKKMTTLQRLQDNSKLLAINNNYTFRLESPS